MANAKKSSTDKKSAPKTKTKKTEEVVTKSNTQTIVITVLATVLACFIIVLAVLLCTGVIKFSSNGNEGNQPVATKPDDDKKIPTDVDDDDTIIDNPYPKVTVKGNLVEVDDLEFYLPYAFKAGGKNKDGAYAYNLENDDGWAQVLVYAEKSSLSPTRFLNKISSYLDITDEDYEINGTEWVQAENASILAYATKLDGKIYAVYYAVKLDSDTTSEAMQMIPKTLYMKKIERK